MSRRTVGGMVCLFHGLGRIISLPVTARTLSFCLLSLFADRVAGQTPLQARSPLLVYDSFRSAPAPQNPGLDRFVIAEIDSFNSYVALTIQLARPIKVVLTHCGGIGGEAYSAGSITLCHETLGWFRDHLGTHMPNDQRSLLQDGLWFILAHELAHGIVETYRVPVAGDEEAAMDQLGAILIVSEVGGSLLLSAISQLEDSTAVSTHHGI